MLMVSEPERIEPEPPKSGTNAIMPKSPYTMDGTPAKISMAERMMRTRMLPRLAYSLRNIAVIMPTGTAKIRLIATAYNVVIMAGKMVIFSEANSYFP